MTEDELLRLAVCIAEYDSAIAHLHAIQRVGETVPWGLFGRISRELEQMCVQWVHAHGEAWADRETVTRAVQEARELCTAKQAEVDELLRDEE